jgi:hypothetical protein
VWNPVQDQDASEHRRVGAKVIPPHRVAEDRDGRGTGVEITIAEEPAHLRGSAQNHKERTICERASRAKGSRVIERVEGHPGAERRQRGDGRQSSRPVAESAGCHADHLG